MTILTSPTVGSADINGDGLVDLASAASDGGQPAVAVFLSAGDGMFGSPINRIVSNGYSAFALGDFDGDGKIDLVTRQGQHLAFFKGNGNGTFQDEIDTSLASYIYPRAIYAVDLDSDGKLDLLERSDGAATYFYKGNGNGTFVDAILATPLTLADQFAIADLDGDGRPDLAVPSGGSVGVLRGNGDGTFGAAAYFVAGASAGSVAAGDFDGDGKLDLAVTVIGHVAFLKGLGDATFLASIEYQAGPNPVGAVAADFDGDGKLDVAVANGDAFSTPGTSVSILYGNGTGAFSAPVSYIVPGSSALVAADFTGEGVVDLARFSSVCCYFTTVTVLINDGGRSFEGAEATAVGLAPNVLAAGDFDGDGRLDLAAAGSGAPDIRIMRGGPEGLFQPGALLLAGNYPAALAVGDFDSDGALDLVVANVNDANFQIFLGKGDGTFQAPVAYAVAQPFSGAAGALAVSDFDGDGKLDVAAAAAFGFGSPAIQFFHGLGDGTFSPAVSGQVLDFFPSAFVVSDLNGDGLSDLVAFQSPGYSNPNYIMVLLGNGDGTFAPPEDLSAGTSPGSVAVGDFDEDGFPDLAVANGDSASVSILFGNGDGTFAPAVQIGLASNPWSIVAADFDGDGHLDFATANGQDGTVFVAIGLGNGTFRSPVAYGLGAAAFPLALGDWDGTGSLDLAVGLSSSQIAVLFNTKLAVSAPASLTVCGGAGVTFQVSASGFHGVHYQWRKDGAPLADGGNVSGATSATLALASTTASDAGSYDVLVTDACGTLASAAAVLTVPAKLAAPTIAVPASVPPGSAGVTASVPNAPGHSYQWSLTGGSITGGQGTHAITFSAGAAGTTMSLEVVDSLSAGCSSDPGQAKVQVDFLDVPPSYLFHDAVVSIARAGISSGCGAGRYCPEVPVSRSSMSVFILRGEHGAAFVPPDATGTVFSDVTTSTFLAKWIEQFGNEGISTGCGGGNYCPGDAVNRASMAVFLLRGKYGSSYDPPPATGTVFADVQVDTFLAKWMEKLKLDGITSGCGGGNYCPNGTVSRGEMAALVKKTFGL